MIHALTTKQSIARNKMTDKKKILMLCDHPLVPSGVGTQARYLIEGLLATKKYSFVVLGGAVKHPDYRPQKVSHEVYGDDWIIHPVDGYGDKNKMREMLANEKPDAILLFTDPRFFVWVWEMEDEIRSQCPILYWHVWDNDPTPVFNRPFYDSTDFISALSLKTFGLLQDMKLKNVNYIPHSVSPQFFHPISEDEVTKFKKENFGPHADKKFVVFWNNRNARRKMTGDVMASFAKFLNKTGKNNSVLVMHTLVSDPEGQNIVEVAKQLDIERNLIISEGRVNPDVLNGFYNSADCTINIANNEGFGLSTLESLMSGTPIVVQMTGGLQFQIGDWWESLNDFSDQERLFTVARNKYSSNKGMWFGVPVFPAVRSCTGSQPVPYIYDDRVSHEDVVKGLTKLFEMGRQKRREIGLNASIWARRVFNQDSMIASWDKTMFEQIKNFKETTKQSFRLESI